MGYFLKFVDDSTFLTDLVSQNQTYGRHFAVAQMFQQLAKSLWCTEKSLLMLILYTHLARGKVHNYIWDAKRSVLKKKKSSQLEISEGIREMIGFNPFQLNLKPASADGAESTKSAASPVVDEGFKQKIVDRAARMKSILFNPAKPSCVVVSWGPGGNFPIKNVYSCIVKILTGPHHLQVGTIRDCGIWDEHFKKCINSHWKNLHKIGGAFETTKDAQIAVVPMLVPASAQQRRITDNQSSEATTAA